MNINILYIPQLASKPVEQKSFFKQFGFIITYSIKNNASFNAGFNLLFYTKASLVNTKKCFVYKIASFLKYISDFKS